ncbi:MAG: glycosyltransferase family 2 protein, partial [Saprospiraceae bacterium]
TANWLLSLQETAYTSKEYGIVGAKILYPDGSLQEFGAELYADGTGINIGKGDNPNLKKYNQLKEVGYVSGCAMYIKRSTINTIGTFDEQFHPCYFEDSDYCYAAKEKQLKTVVTPHSVVYHEEGSTAGTSTNSGFKQYQLINRAKFLAKHKSKLN